MNTVNDIVLVPYYTKVDKKNLRYLFNSDRGKIYFRRVKKAGAFELCESWSYEDLYEALAAGKVDLIWIAGSSLGTHVSIEE